jgi:hypothetical protein
MRAADRDLDVQIYEMEKRNCYCVLVILCTENINTYIYKIGNHKWSIV